jgi:orotate phosphoribosyltransferase
MPLFTYGRFHLHSGDTSSFLIDCDELSRLDLVGLAAIAAKKLLPAFGSVCAIPEGGLKFGEHLLGYCTSGPVLIVDDVCTTGTSLEERREALGLNEKEALGIVIFNRGNLPVWCECLFHMSANVRYKL